MKAISPLKTDGLRESRRVTFLEKAAQFLLKEAQFDHETPPKLHSATDAYEVGTQPNISSLFTTPLLASLDACVVDICGGWRDNPRG